MCRIAITFLSPVFISVDSWIFDDTILQRSTKKKKKKKKWPREKPHGVTTTEATVTSVVSTSPNWAVLPQCTFQLITSGNR